jgi:hypothetical protein
LAWVSYDWRGCQVEERGGGFKGGNWGITEQEKQIEFSLKARLSIKKITGKSHKNKLKNHAKLNESFTPLTLIHSKPVPTLPISQQACPNKIVINRNWQSIDYQQ